MAMLKGRDWFKKIRVEFWNPSIQLKGRGWMITLILVLGFSSVLSAQSFQSDDRSLLKVKTFSKQDKWNNLEPQILDFRYAPLLWQTCIGLPDDPHKTVVGSDGGLYYNFIKPNGPSTPLAFEHFNTRITASMVGETAPTPVHQDLLDDRIPVAITEKKKGDLLLHQEAWARAPQRDGIEEWAPRRVDYLWLTMKNNGSKTESGQIVLHVRTKDTLVWKGNKLGVKRNPEEVILSIDPANVSVENQEGSVQLFLPEKELTPGEEYQALITLYPGKFAQPFNRSEEMYEDYKTFAAAAHEQTVTSTIVAEAEGEKTRAIEYWKEVSLPYEKIMVPDKNIQRLLDSSIRNIYQARELQNGRPVFQVGPTYYRGSWAADGPFIMEAITYLGGWQEVRAGLEQQVDQDTGPGGVAFSKKTGLRLWMVWRHAQLTGDWEWLEEMWPKVERDVNLIMKYREMSRNDSSKMNDGLMPEGFGDGGLGGKHHEYSNVYWTLSGLQAAIEMADKMGKSVLSDWQTEYQDYWETFDKARNRDKLIDARGNVYVPPTMTGEEKQLPQRGVWAFLQAVYPGHIFAKEDSLMLGTMAMLDDTQQQGLIYGTGWQAHGIWNYAASFYAHAHLWLGHGKKAASTLYAFGNHASPLLTWREEQYPVGQQRGEKYQGDMPHNWASAEFIRLIRHLMILERDDELHLLEGLPQAWTRAGDETKMVDIPTSFGNMSLTVTMAENGQSVRIKIDPPRRRAPQKMVVHLEQFERPIWSITVNDKYIGSSGTVEVPTDRPITLEVEFKHSVEERYSHPE